MRDRKREREREREREKESEFMEQKIGIWIPSATDRIV